MSDYKEINCVLSKMLVLKIQILLIQLISLKK